MMLQTCVSRREDLSRHDDNGVAQGIRGHWSQANRPSILQAQGKYQSEQMLSDAI